MSRAVRVGLSALALVLVQALHAGADLGAQLDPPLGFDLPLHHLLALHRLGFQPLHRNPRQLGGRRAGRAVWRRVVTRDQAFATEQPGQQQQGNQQRDDPGALAQQGEHGDYS